MAKSTQVPFPYRSAKAAEGKGSDIRSALHGHAVLHGLDCPVESVNVAEALNEAYRKGVEFGRLAIAQRLPVVSWQSIAPRDQIRIMAAHSHRHVSEFPALPWRYVPGNPGAWEIANTKPAVLYRQSDGQRFIRNSDDTYSYESSGMHKPHRYTYERLMGDDGFAATPPETVEPDWSPSRSGCGGDDDEGCSRSRE